MNTNLINSNKAVAAGGHLNESHINITKLENVHQHLLNAATRINSKNSNFSKFCKQNVEKSLNKTRLQNLSKTGKTSLKIFYFKTLCYITQ